MMSKALAKRQKAVILYATETGKSERYAKMLGELFSHAFDPKVRSRLAFFAGITKSPSSRSASPKRKPKLIPSSSRVFLVGKDTFNNFKCSSKGLHRLDI